MGNFFGKDGPLIKLSCVHVTDAHDINITRVDGVEKKEDKEEKIKKNLCFRFKKKKIKKKEMAGEKKKVHLQNKEIEELVSLNQKRKSKKSEEKISDDFEVKKNENLITNE